LLISTTGCSLSMGRDLSLLGEPAGSQASRISHRSRAPLRSNQLIHQKKYTKKLNQIAFTFSNLKAY